MTNPYMWPPRPQQPPRLAAGWARKRYVLPALGIAFTLGIYFGIVLGIVAGASDDGTRTDDAKPAAASPGPTVTVTATAKAKAKPAPTVTATKTVKVTVTAQPSADNGDDSDNSGTSGGSGAGGQTDVQFGYACSPVGALAIAEDGRPAKCFRGKDGRARWGYDSNRG
ncbi:MULTISPECIES: hypothetical protein [Streptomyces]|uniref:hypothetical protein n=1 Tax=Streptomyces TaxID=1883 RepID=UPI0015C51076|nr:MULTISPECIES: hypothetical protein [Streptomyces]MDX3611691.1 hypothetical protein [Streptomyces europaeiscabiei]MDX3632091.1 hypothetical protein [Streptomyces europaeiscabiei]MDX3649815.1 hypothetical protein [Streptomyces europaeiscabiei]